MAPLVVKNKVLVGNSGGEMGVRGWLTALDTNSGKVLWRAYATGPDKDVLIGARFKPYYAQDRGQDLGVKSWPPDAWKIGGGGSWAQKSLVIAQATVSLVLLSAAALLGRSLRNLEHQNFGFETQGRYIAWINPMLGNYKMEQMEPMFRQIDDSLLQIPGGFAHFRSQPRDS